MTTIEKPKFLFTFITNHKGNMSASSTLYDSFDKAIAKMNSEADRLSIYSGNVMTKKIGINKLRANVVIKSKYVDVVLQVAPLAKQDNDVISTNGWDYDYAGIALI